MSGFSSRLQQAASATSLPTTLATTRFFAFDHFNLTQDLTFSLHSDEPTVSVGAMYMVTVLDLHGRRP